MTDLDFLLNELLYRCKQQRNLLFVRTTTTTLNVHFKIKENTCSILVENNELQNH